MSAEADPNATVRKVLEQATTIAVVGASSDETKPSYSIPKFMLDQGYRVIPVNPRAPTIFGRQAAASLADVDVPVDVVNVFRPAAEAAEIARQAVAIGAKVLWLQLGIESEEARGIAEAGGLTFVQNRCIGATFRQLGIKR